MSDRPVVTRFAPSPTGYLHIGGARTALFNWLYARHCGGTFLLRIEDTDRARSTPEATAAIYAGLRWLGLDHDGAAISQASRAGRHAAVAREMLARGTAYKCFSTPEEIDAARETARKAGAAVLFESPWRDTAPGDHPDAPFVVRLRAPKTGKTIVEDAVQGRVEWDNAGLDDLVLLRSDGTPTYMHAVVVDDHDMGVTHVIRGDDHLTNAARQSLIYAAMGWEIPRFAHIPLIHGADGKKLSKRHGALGLEEYARMGYLPEAMRNYLARLGWSHGDDEFFTDAQAIEWFDFTGIKKAAARLDPAKLDHVSGQHIGAADDARLVAAIAGFCALTGASMPTAEQEQALEAAMYCLKDRAKTLPELIAKAHFLLGARPYVPDAAAAGALDPVSIGMLGELTSHLQDVSWVREDLEAAVKAFAEAKGTKLGKLAQPLRAALCGRTVSPSVFDMMALIGRQETLARLGDAIERGVTSA